MKPYDLAALERDVTAAEGERCTRSFRIFAERAWPHVVPGEKYRHNWHIDAMIDHLEAVRLGQINQLIINVPPGHSKSILCSVLWPAWLWIHNPFWRIITATYAATLSTRDAIKMRELVASDWYQKHWGQRVKLDSVRDTQVDFWTTMRGQRFSTSTGGVLTGQHAHVQIVDDPLNAVDATSELARHSANEWLSQALSTRWVPGNPTRQVIIMQRLHEDDPTGYLLKQGGYEHLCLRAEYEPGTYVTSIGKYDHRTKPGEVLWPELYPPKRIEQLKKALGSYGTAGQLQQNPSPAVGGILKIDNWQRYTPSEIPERFDQVIQSWDMRFKRTTSEQSKNKGDYVVGVVIGQVGARLYLLDLVRGLWGFKDSRDEVVKLSAKWPDAVAKYVENKANGPGIVDALEEDIPGLTLVEPKGDKMQRALLVVPYHEAGNLFIPEAGSTPWVDDFVAECAKFPNGRNDDQLDAYSQGVIEINSGGLAYLRAMAGMSTLRA